MSALPAGRLALPAARRPAGAALLARVGRGDQAAFAELYHRTAAPVPGLAALLLGDDAAAGDVAAAVYRQLRHTATTYDPARGSVHPWLMGVAHRHAAGHLRARRVPAAAPAAQLASLTPAWLPAALELLGPLWRELILLACYHGRTAAQAARLPGLTAGTALPLLRPALCALPLAPAPGTGGCSGLPAPALARAGRREAAG